MTHTNSKKTHLMIGPLPPPLGGATVLFQQLVTELNDLDQQVRVINTVSDKNKLINFFRVLLLVIIDIFKVSSVSFHGSLSGVTMFSPFICILAKLLNKKIVVRTFGGGFDLKYEKIGWFRQWVFKSIVLQADSILFETHASVDKFKKLTHKNVVWYPNSRPRPVKYERGKSLNSTTVIFIGHIKQEKGVLDLLQAAKEQCSFRVHFYGPLVGDIQQEDLMSPYSRYMGQIPSADVSQVISQYPLFILPTHYSGEGYPGVIIEAYMAGVPVVSTKWRCIPEIVDSSCGCLVNIKDTQALGSVITELLGDVEKLSRLQIGALRKSDDFYSVHWTKYFLSLLD